MGRRMDQVGVCASSQQRYDAVFKSSLDCGHERRFSKPARHNFCVIAEIASKTNQSLFRCKEDVASPAASPRAMSGAAAAGVVLALLV